MSDEDLEPGRQTQDAHISSGLKSNCKKMIFQAERLSILLKVYELCKLEQKRFVKSFGVTILDFLDIFSELN